MDRIVIIILSIIFTLFSFGPSFSEIAGKKDTPPDRVFVLEHNYMFDYNFYLSRIKEGQDGHFLVTEKYYNQPHRPSLFQIIYLYLGKIGSLFKAGPPEVYHASRLIFGFLLLYLTGELILKIIPKGWQVWTFLLTATSGSYPVLIHLQDGTYRLSSYMGWWSAIDPLHRITFIPHVVLGQIFILVFIRVMTDRKYWKGEPKSFKVLRFLKRQKIVLWSITGLAVGIVFPPTLIVVYPVLAAISVFEIFTIWNGRVKDFKLAIQENREMLIARTIFVFVSFWSFVYLKLAFGVMPWKALALFDIQHRTLIPYPEYFKSLGITYPLGLFGIILVFVKREWKYIPLIFWVGTVFLLFKIFESVPEQSPLRFTEAAVHIPLSILSGYLLFIIYSLFSKRIKGKIVIVPKIFIKLFMSVIIIAGLLLMYSSYLWWRDQGYAKRVGGWLVPLGVQLSMPLKDFMDPIIWMKDNIKKDKVILAYITAGNYIPAYAGQYVYIGHANTPDEDGKEKIAAKFYGGKMGEAEAVEFLRRERIDYIYFGIQEKEFGVQDLTAAYPFLKLKEVYGNTRVKIYKLN